MLSNGARGAAGRPRMRLRRRGLRARERPRRRSPRRPNQSDRCEIRRARCADRSRRCRLRNRCSHRCCTSRSWAACRRATAPLAVEPAGLRHARGRSLAADWGNPHGVGLWTLVIGVGMHFWTGIRGLAESGREWVQVGSCRGRRRGGRDDGKGAGDDCAACYESHDSSYVVGTAGDGLELSCGRLEGGRDLGDADVGGDVPADAAVEGPVGPVMARSAAASP